MRGDPPTYIPAGSKLHLGPLGEFEVPFTATQGLVGLCVLICLFVFVPIAFTVRWRKQSRGIV
jgi:hypothetical protein